ncbi:MAG: ABC transporter permease subunit [Fimbriiglobus sp.]
MEKHFDPEALAPRLTGIAIVAIVLGLFVGAWYGWLAVASGVRALLFVCYSREDGFLLFGPFPKYDALTNVRGRRTHLIRAGVAIGAMLFFWLHSNMKVDGLSPSETAEYLNSRLINRVAIILGIAVPLLTLFYMPGMIIEERSGKRWDVMLTTDLRAREILFGKLLGRLWLALEPVVVLIPVFAMLPLVVGLSPAVMLIYGTAVFLTMLALTGISVLVSTWQESRMAGVFWVFAISCLYLVFTLCISIIPSTKGFSYPAPIQLFVEFLSSANPYATYLHVVKAPSTATPSDLAAALQQYSAGSIAVFLGGMLLAASRLRQVEQTPPPRTKPEMQVTDSQAAVDSAAQRLPVSDEPITWWLVARSRFFGFTARSLVLFFLAALCVFGLIHLSSTLLKPRGSGSAEPLVELVIIMGVAIPVLVPVGLATACIANERSGDTFEILRTTPLTSQEMLDQYRAGAIKVHQILMLLWAIPAFAAVLTGFFETLTALVLGLVPLIIMPHLISFSLYCSANAETPARAFRDLIFVGLLWHFLIFIAVIIMLSLIPEQFGFVFHENYVAAGGLAVYWLLGNRVYRQASSRFERSRMGL